jgi:hypothetical protein
MYYIFGFIGLVIASLIAGEVVTSYLPNSKFAKWWRNTVISECQDCE